MHGPRIISKQGSWCGLSQKDPCQAFSKNLICNPNAAIQLLPINWILPHKVQIGNNDPNPQTRERS